MNIAVYLSFVCIFFKLQQKLILVSIVALEGQVFLLLAVSDDDCLEIKVD